MDVRSAKKNVRRSEKYAGPAKRNRRSKKPSRIQQLFDICLQDPAKRSDVVGTVEQKELDNC